MTRITSPNRIAHPHRFHRYLQHRPAVRRGGSTDGAQVAGVYHFKQEESSEKWPHYGTWDHHVVTGTPSKVVLVFIMDRNPRCWGKKIFFLKR
jgi:hypothetical protein